MTPSFRRRQLITGALVANAIRPVPGYWLGVPAMAAGGVASEFAPYLLVGALADSARELATTPRDRLGLALGAAAVGGLGVLVQKSIRSRDIVESALRDALGADYRSYRPGPDPDLDRETGWGQLVSPISRVPAGVRVTKDIDYSGEGGKQGRLDVYQPRDTTAGPAPILLHVHGGAWMSGDKSWDCLPLIHHMVARGWVVVSMNYRLSPAHAFPAHMIDVKRALAWIKENGADFGGDTSFVATTGGSAGGHLAALAALTPGDRDYQPGFEDADTSVQACVPRYGIYDFTGDSATNKSVSRRDSFLAPRVMMKEMISYEESFQHASPLHQVNAEAPPFFVIHGKNDTGVEVEEGRYFVERLRAASRAPVAYAELPATQHGFDMLPSIRTSHVIRGTRRFLEWCYARHRDAN